MLVLVRKLIRKYSVWVYQDISVESLENKVYEQGLQLLPIPGIITLWRHKTFHQKLKYRQTGQSCTRYVFTSFLVVHTEHTFLKILFMLKGTVGVISSDPMHAKMAMTDSQRYS